MASLACYLGEPPALRADDVSLPIWMPYTGRQPGGAMRRFLLGFGLMLVPLSAQEAGVASRAIGVLEQRCWGCHGPALAQSGLRLNSREAALQGGNRGPALVVGNPAASRIAQI